jgi:murein DD-endopeptidase MepM/ murein hydrolase activator NlpD
MPCTISSVFSTPRLVSILLPISFVAAIAITGCAGGEARPAATPTRVPTTTGTVTEPTATATATEAPAAFIEPSPTELPPEPTATEAPPAPAIEPSPAASIEVNPPQLVLGGAVIVYLNADASAATMTFGGLQYPMVFDGTRWWAVAGVGAFSETGEAPVTIVYSPSDGPPEASIEGSIPIAYREFTIENIQLDPGTSALLDPAIVNNEEALRASIFAGYTTQRLWDGPFLAPADAPLSSTYGIGRSYNSAPVSSYHRGTDFAGAEGDPAYAAAGGRVVFARELMVRGNTIIIDHGAGVFTAYCHLSAISVSEGEVVDARQLIGQIGSTGLVTGPHLHWEVVVRGVEVDGELWLAGAAGQ